MINTQSVSGPTMKNMLRDCGIEAQQVTQKRDSGFYVAEFYQPKMENPVASSRVWAEAITERLPNVTIIDQHDTVASWRIGKPVIWASVTFGVK